MEKRMNVFCVVVHGLIPKHKEEATDDIREKGERGQKNGRSIQTRNK
jgi:hypothetical protein